MKLKKAGWSPTLSSCPVAPLFQRAIGTSSMKIQCCTCRGTCGTKPEGSGQNFLTQKAEGAPTTPTKDTPKYSREEMDSLLKIHHQFTKLILRLGVDPCKAYKEQNVKNILQHIDANDLDCKVCGKSYTNASRMRLHIQQKHIGVTNYQCTTCYKLCE